MATKVMFADSLPAEKKPLEVRRFEQARITMHAMDAREAIEFLNQISQYDQQVYLAGKRSGTTAAESCGNSPLAESPWIIEALRLPPEETRLALAVVFPELIRYGYLQDKIQVRAHKVLYVQYGRKYANFSVGRFQMKPSFIEQLEADWNALLSEGEKTAAGLPAFVPGETSARRQDRILRLESIRWQVDYLRVFMAVMKKRYADAVFGGVEDRLRFYATAYNAGYAAGQARLRKRMPERHFHLELFSPERTYNYADIALFYFRRSEP